MAAGFPKLREILPSRGDDRERPCPSKPSLMTVYPQAIASWRTGTNVANDYIIEITS
jgi:hypothetical protein